MAKCSMKLDFLSDSACSEMDELLGDLEADLCTEGVWVKNYAFVD